MEFNTQDIKKMSQMAQNMQGKSENDTIKELANMVKSGQGGMTPAKFEQMVAMIAPMLDNEQKKKLEKLIKELKG